MNTNETSRRDVKETYSDTTKLEDWIGFKPNTSIKYGVNEFVRWYKNHYSK